MIRLRKYFGSFQQHVSRVYHSRVLSLIEILGFFYLRKKLCKEISLKILRICKINWQVETYLVNLLLTGNTVTTPLLE